MAVMTTAAIDWEDQGRLAEGGPATAAADGALRPWEDPSVLALGQEPAHDPRLEAYADRAAAIAAGEERPWTLPLDGAWRFHLAERPEAVPAGWWEPGFDDRAWGAIAVPGHWETQGHGQPIYTNITYPFPPAPPRVPVEDNPTGCHRLAFTVPAGWEGRDPVLVFDGIDGHATVRLNGRLVGVSTVARCPAEFRIGALLRPGVNVLAVEVVRWSFATYLQDQDQWWLSGIFRPVRLVARPRTRVQDVVLRTTLDGGRARVSLAVEVRATAAGGPVRVEAELHEPDGRSWSAVVALDLPAGGTAGGELAFVIDRPALWTAETPVRHHLVLRLADGAGATLAWYGLRNGLCTVAISAGRLLVNGAPVLLQGVNRHEFHPERGRALTRQDQVDDILRLKRLNLNAVRTSHYPDQALWYGLCEEHGLYVLDEADLETHGLMDRLTADPAWEPAYTDRAERLVRRDRNFACVVMWSPGNESGHGCNILAAIARIRALDPTRPVTYYHAGEDPAVDAIGLHYPSMAKVQALLDREGSGRPVLLEEYAHAMGSNLGGMTELWDFIRARPRLIGGFVWEWCDHGLSRDDGHGGRFLAFGGDCGDRPHDGHWCIDGVCLPDHTPKPGAWALHAVFAPVAMRRQGDALVVTNRRFHRDLADLDLVWTVRVDGRAVAEGAQAAPDARPGGEAAVVLPPAAWQERHGHRAWLTVSVRQAGATSWCPAGHEVACWQQDLPVRRPGRARVPAAAPVIGEVAGVIDIRQGPARLCLDRAQARLSLFAWRGRPLVLAGPVLHWWRAPLCNDKPFVPAWKAAHLHRLDREAVAMEVSTGPDGVAFCQQARWLTPAGALVGEERIDGRLDGAGVLHLRVSVRPAEGLPTLPRLGTRLVLPATLGAMRWFGRGPHETLCDRQDGAPLGVYEATVAELAVPYPIPQDHGMRSGVRWLQCHGGAGPGLLVAADEDLTVALRDHTTEQLSAARHPQDLGRSPELELCLDHRYAGTGNTSHAGERLPQHQVEPAACAWTLRLTGCAPDEREASWVLEGDRP